MVGDFTNAKWSAEAQTATGISPKGAIYTSPGVMTQSAPQTFASRSASRVEAAGERFLLTVSPPPWVTDRKKGEPFYETAVQGQAKSYPKLDIIKESFLVRCGTRRWG